MRQYALLVVFLELLLVSARYPKRSLQCYSTFTKPDYKLICPEARNSYCVKEIVNLEVNLCGATQYFGDIYASGVCLLRKCSDECIPGSYDFTYGGNTYQRTRFCCDKDYCNAGSSKYNNVGKLLIFSLLTAVWVLAIY